MAGVGTNITIKAAGITRLLSIPVGKSAEIQNLILVGGTTSTGSTIDNAGSLILRDCHIKPATGSNAIPLRNNGTLSVFGLTDIVH
jgi:hypothetical protein